MSTNPESVFMQSFQVPNYMDIVALIYFKSMKDDEYLKDLRKAISAKHINIHVEHVTGNLFTSEPSWALAHCVSTDLSIMSAEFRRRFGAPSELQRQLTSIGVPKVAYIPNLSGEGRFIFYLQTKDKKKKSKESPYLNLYWCLRRMKVLCYGLNQYRVAFSRVGCGLDKLNFNRVLMLIKIVFKNSGIRIRIYSDIEDPGIFHSTGYSTDMKGTEYFDDNKIQKCKNSSLDEDTNKDTKELDDHNINKVSKKIKLIEFVEEEGIIDLTVDPVKRII